MLLAMQYMNSNGIMENDAREDGESMSEVVSVSEMFGKDVFNDAVMKDRLPKSVYKKLKKTIEDGAELVVDGLEIDRRIGLAVLVLVVQHLILPGDNLLGCDFTHFQFAEIGQQLGTDDMFLGGPGILLEPGFYVCRVEVHEALKGHVQVGSGFIKLLPLPCLCLPLGLEAPLLGLLARTIPVGIAVDRPPGVGLFFLIDRHQYPSLPFRRSTTSHRRTFG